MIIRLTYQGFEQCNRYVIMDPQGNHIGYLFKLYLTDVDFWRKKKDISVPQSVDNSSTRIGHSKPGSSIRKASKFFS